jgi:hypothetical protein
MKTLEERLTAIEEKLGIAEAKPEYVWVAVLKGAGFTCGVCIHRIRRDSLSQDVDSAGDYVVDGGDAREITDSLFINKVFVDPCPKTLKARLHNMVDAAFVEAMSYE